MVPKTGDFLSLWNLLQEFDRINVAANVLQKSPNILLVLHRCRYQLLPQLVVVLLRDKLNSQFDVAQFIDNEIQRVVGLPHSLHDKHCLTIQLVLLAYLQCPFKLIVCRSFQKVNQVARIVFGVETQLKIVKFFA